MNDVFYRFDTTDDGVPWLTTYRVIKRTPAGAWLDNWGDNKFVLLGAGKRFAHETLALALESYEARQRRRCVILTAQLQRTHDAIAFLDCGDNRERLRAGCHPSQLGQVPWSLDLTHPPVLKPTKEWT